MIHRTNIWNREQIETRRQEIKLTVDQRFPEGSGERLGYICEQMVESKTESQLDRYLYTVFALAENNRCCSLTQSEVTQMIHLAQSILKEKGILQTGSRLSYLHGDLYLAQSQHHRLNGNLVVAIWQKQIAMHLSHRASEIREAFQALSSAVHLLRLGHVGLALQELQGIAISELGVAAQIRFVLEYHMALRLEYRFQEALALRNTYETLFEQANASQKMEWKWEKECLRSQMSGSVENLMKLVRPRKTFAGTLYAVEAFILAYVVRETEWMQSLRFPRISREQKSQDPRYKVLCHAARVLSESYDSERDYVLRLKELGKISARLHELPTLYHELLVRGAIVRWLIRRPARPLSDVFVAEYHALCLKISAGKTQDVLNLLGDI